MKKIYIAWFLSLCLSVFAYADHTDDISESWLKSASLTRQAYLDRGDAYELIQYDRDTLSRIYEGELNLGNDGMRKLMSLLHQIVIDNPRPDEKSIVKAIDILAQKADDKLCCANLMLELVSTNKIPNYRVMVKVLDTAAVILSNETSSKIFMTLGMLYGKIDAFLFDSYAPGADMVLRSLMEFIAQYCDLVTNKKTLDDNYRGKICELADKLDLGKEAENNKMSQYSYLKNWERSGRAFYFYKLKEEYDLNDDDPGQSKENAKGM